jgi:Tfp pilus assembly PilM family ATPase
MNALAARRVLSPIGLDLGTRAIKAAQLVRGRRGFRLTASLSLARLDPGPALSARDAERLGPALVRAGFRGRSLAAALPSELALHANIDLPARGSKAPLDEIAASELARVSRAAAEDLVCAHWPTSPARAGEACPSRVVGAERARIDALLDSLDQVAPGARRLVPLALDTAPWALARCLTPWLGEAEDVTVIADIGWRRCALTIVRGQRIIYERLAAGIGLEPLREAIVHDLAAAPEAIDRLLQRLDDGSAPDAAGEIARAAIGRQAHHLAQEVERSLRFAAEMGAHGAYRLILVGGGASAAMTEAVTPPLDGLAEVRRATPAELVSGAPGPAAADPGLICAIGLAMRMDR